jgi:hypothetical protein
MVQVNRVRDFIERVVWTLIEVIAGAGIAELVVDDAGSWWTVLFAGLVAAAKVAIAQRAGTHSDGAAIPGGVIEPQPPRV